MFLSELHAAMGNPPVQHDGWFNDCPSCSIRGAAVLEMHGGRPHLSTLCGCSVDDLLRALNVSAAELDAVQVDLAQFMPAESPSADEPKSRKFGAANVVDYIEQRYNLAVTTDGVPIAAPKDPAGARMACEVKDLRQGLTAALWRAERVAVSQQTISTALETAAGLAREGERLPVGMRSTVRGDELFLDLGDASGRIVRVTGDGWAVEDPDGSHPLFRRPSNQMPLPVPVRGGSMDALRELLRLGADDSRWTLIRGWLVAVLFDDIPRPLLWAMGPQGSGKSTRARMVMSVVEPAEALGAPPGRNERDDSVAAKAQFLVSYDNISQVSQAASDWLCRLVTGGADNRRTMYTDDELRTGSYRRSGVATSIVMPSGLGSDAVERLVQVPFSRMPNTERASETELWGSFADAHAAILGALLDDVSRALRHRAEATARRGVERPRMADYGNVLMALDMAHGTDGAADGFLGVYFEKVSSSLADRALDDPLALAVLKLVHDTAGSAWAGTAQALLNRVCEYAGDPKDLPRWWPKSARAMSAQLTKAGESLLHAGVKIEKSRSGDTRLISLTAVADLSQVVDDDYEVTPAGKVKGPGIFA